MASKYDTEAVFKAWNETGSYQQMMRLFDWPSYNAMYNCLAHARARGVVLRDHKTQYESLYEHCDKSHDPDGCWTWKRTVGRDGYGKVQSPYGLIATHRASWIITFGSIPDGLWVLHKCDNRKCINPTHLFLGTRHDNIADMMRKKRNVKGVGRPIAVLTDELVAELRKRYDAGQRICDLARWCEKSYDAIYYAVHRKTWRHVQ